MFKSHGAIDHCSFVQTTTGADGKQEMAYAFEMTRMQYAKADWPSTSPTDLPGMTNNFRIGPVTAAKMSAEAKN